MYSAVDVANWFIYRIKKDYENPTSLKIMKLLYYAQGCFEMLNDEPLFSEPLLGWEHGPVVRVIWDKFPNSYELNVSDDEIESSVSKFTDYEMNFLEHVYQMFGQYSAWKLREMTHSETPWNNATDNGTKFNGTIELDDIKAYFADNYYGDYIAELSKDIDNSDKSFKSIDDLMEELDA